MFIYEGFKFPIHFHIEKKLNTLSYPHILVAQTENSK